MPWKRRQLDQSVAPFRRARGAASRDPVLLAITVFIANKVVKIGLSRTFSHFLGTGVQRCPLQSMSLKEGEISCIPGASPARGRPCL